MAGLCPSIRRLAGAIGVDNSQAAKVLRIADLPDDVLAAFNSPCDIQVNWAVKLDAAVRRDPQGVRRLALAAAPAKRDSKHVFRALAEHERGVEPFHNPVQVVNTKSGARAAIAAVKGGFTVRVTGISATDVERAVRRLVSA